MRLINDDVDVVSMCKLHAEWPIDAIILYVENGHASLAVEFPGGVGGGEDGDGQLESDGDSVVKVLKLGPNRTIRPGKLRTLSIAIFLASITILWEKSRDPCEPWSNCMVLRTVTGF